MAREKAAVPLAAITMAGMLVFFCASAWSETAGAGETGAAATAEASRLKGRDFVRLGKMETLTGTLKRMRGEWFLTVKDVDHELHLGDHEHRAKTGIALEVGKTATVKGFVYKQEKSEQVDVAVCTITLDGKEYRFRNDDGSPLWRGRSAGQGGAGAGQGTAAGPGDGTGRGAGAGARRGTGGGAGNRREE